MHVVETVKILGCWKSNYSPKNHSTLGMMNLYEFYTSHLWRQNHIDLFCSCQTQWGPRDLCTWFIGTGDSSLKVPKTGANMCQQKWEIWPNRDPFSFNLTMKKTGSRNVGIHNIPQDHAGHPVFPLSLPGNAQPLPSNIRTFVAP